MAINLLPLKQKRFARSVYRTHRLIAIMIVFNLLLLSLLVLLVALRINVQRETKVSVKTLATLGGKSPVVEFNALRDEVNLIAKYANVAKANLKDASSTTDYFNQVLVIRPSGLGLTSFEYKADGVDQKVKLGGVAASRQNLIDFSSRLESLPWVGAVDSPVTNLVGDSNFLFSLTLTVAKNKK